MGNETQGMPAHEGEGTVEPAAVAVLADAPERASALAAALRGHGFRCRHFINPRVLLNATRQFAPAAIVADGTLLENPVSEACVQSARERIGASLVVLGRHEPPGAYGDIDAELEAGAGAEQIATHLHGLLGEGNWRQRLKQALAEDHFRLAYQPILRPDGTSTGLHEALLRLSDPSEGELLPGRFLPAAARLGLRRHIDRWVLLRALDVINASQEPTTPTLFVKVFPETACTPSFPGWLGQQLRQRARARGRLVVELPHPDVMAEPDAYRPLAAILQYHRCSVALSHFSPEDPATAMENLFPARYLMLAPGLLRGLDDSKAHQRHLQAVVSHARRAGISTIATQVQNPQAMTSLWQAGVDYVQGHLLQAPSPELWLPSIATPHTP